MDKSSTPYTFDRVVRLIITTIVVVGIVLLINRLKGVLLPFMVAWLIAYLLNPLVEWNEKILHLHRRILAIFAAFFEVILALSLIGAIVIPMIVNEVQHFYHLATVYIASADSIPFIPQTLQNFIKEHITLNSIGALLSQDQWVEVGRNAIKQAYNVLSSSIHGIITLFSWCIAILYVFFILLDYDRIIIGFSRLIPIKYRKTIYSIFDDIKSSMNRYFRGQAAVAGIVGVLHCIGFLIIDLPLAIPLGLLVGMLNMIPYMQVLSYIPATILCIIGAADSSTNFWLLAGLTIAVYAIIQIIQDGYIVPRIMGKITGLTPAIILLSLSIWGSLLGFVGLIIALPLTSLLLSYYNQYIIEPGKQQETSSSTHREQSD